jgi:hypothetical protein
LHLQGLRPPALLVQVQQLAEQQRATEQLLSKA